MGNPGCYFYHDGVCKVFIRISGMRHVEHLEEGLCSDCDALTEDEIDALCDNGIMGFHTFDVCSTCKQKYSPSCQPRENPGCNKYTNYWKWEPKTEGP